MAKKNSSTRSELRNRMQEYLDFKGVSDYRLEIELDKSKGSWGKANNPTSDFITRFAKHYPDLSAEWLLRGIGEMLISSDASVVTRSYNKNSILGNNNNSNDVLLSLVAQLAEKDKQINALIAKIQ